MELGGLFGNFRNEKQPSCDGASPCLSGFCRPLVEGIRKDPSAESVSSSAMDPYVFDPSPAVASAGSVSGAVAVAACAAMAFFYVAILYSPTVIFRLPPPASLDNFIIRRFACAAVSSVASVVACGFLLGLGRLDDFSSVLGVLGIRSDHLCQAVFFPLLLTSLLYGGSFVSKAWKLIASRKEGSRENSCSGVDMCVLRCMDWITAYARNVMAWRNYVVAPFTEELVFRACMIPLLLCGGFGTSSVIFLSPVFFSLGNLISPIVAHIFCNVMGLPVLVCPRTKGLATLAAAAGVLCFLWLLFPATSPYLYNDLRDGCSCWHRYCSWS